jgi:hypothetical protein
MCPKDWALIHVFNRARIFFMVLKKPLGLGWSSWACCQLRYREAFKDVADLPAQPSHIHSVSVRSHRDQDV